MLLYHGTSERAALSILRNGLLTRRDSNSIGNWDQCPSMVDAVYLTRAYAPYFACAASELHERWAVLEIDTDKIESDQKYLVPDEDFLEQATRNTDLSNFEGIENKDSTEKKLAWFRENIHNFSHLWKDSLDGLGNCAHIGSIPVSAITRAVSFSPQDHSLLSAMSIDPSISIMNYAICSAKYNALTRWACGYRIRSTDLCDGFAVPVIRINEDRSDEFLRNWVEQNTAIEKAVKDRTGFRVLKGNFSV